MKTSKFFNIVISKNTDRETAQLMVANSEKEAIETIETPSPYIGMDEIIHNEYIIASDDDEAYLNLCGKSVGERRSV